MTSVLLREDTLNSALPGTGEPGDHIRVRSKPVKPLSEGHIYDVLNMSLVVPWKRA